jgi:SAM-dependent methyltransferase
MTTQATQTRQIDQTKLEQLAGQLVVDKGAAMNALLIHLGDRLGLWAAMADLGPTTPAQLAEATGTHPRMLREWLSAQVASGYVAYDAGRETFELPAEQAMLLADDDSPAAMAGAFQVLASVYQDIEKALGALRTGRGLGWGDHHHDLFEGVERFFAPKYRTDLLSTWLPALDGVQARLETGGTVADVGCGHGASALVLAEAHPGITVVGYDNHGPSIETATCRAKERGLEDRVRFEVASAQDFPGRGFDLVAFFDSLHDMADPLGAAIHAREALAPGGTVMVVEPRASDRLEDNLNPVSRLFYAASTLICTPGSLADDGVALGAQAGEARMREVFTEAGFRRFRRATETPVNAVYEAQLD